MEWRGMSGILSWVSRHVERRFRSIAGPNKNAQSQNIREHSARDGRIVEIQGPAVSFSFLLFRQDDANGNYWFEEVVADYVLVWGL